MAGRFCKVLQGFSLPGTCVLAQCSPFGCGLAWGLASNWKNRTKAQDEATWYASSILLGGSPSYWHWWCEHPCSELPERACAKERRAVSRQQPPGNRPSGQPPSRSWLLSTANHVSQLGSQLLPSQVVRWGPKPEWCLDFSLWGPWAELLDKL